jgi:hypothetical protein
VYLIKNVISKYENQKRISIGNVSPDSALGLSARYFPSLVISPLPPSTSKTAGQRKLQVCSHTITCEKSDKYTGYDCEECDIGLYIVDCFKVYHTLKQF